jgi:excisionase family DNA binding protein
MSDDLMTTNEVAERYRVSKQTVLRWVADGMPCIRPSEGVFRFNAAAVAEWIDARTRQLAAAQPQPATTEA